jgi:hypothetical protein
LCISKKRIENLKALFEEAKIDLDMTWEKVNKVYQEANNPIFKTADDLEKLTFVPLFLVFQAYYFVEHLSII